MKIWQKSYHAFSGHEKDMIVVLPIGLIESHGPHLACGSDTLIPLAIAERIDQRLNNVLILPPISYGTGYGDRFMITISSETFENLIKDCLLSMLEKGFEKFVIINGHYENLAFIKSAAEKTGKKFGFIAVNWWDVLSEKTERLFGDESDYAHAGQLETSVLLGINPDLADFSFKNSDKAKENPSFPCKHKCAEYTCYANIERASASKGKITIEDAVEQIVKRIKLEFGE